jgi:ketosteroid isomerase-like protein
MHANEVLLRESYETLERGDWDALRNMLTEDFVLAVAGRNPLAGETRGRDANIARQQRLIRLLGGRPYHTEHIDTAVSDDRVFDYARVTYGPGRRNLHLHNRQRLAERERQVQGGTWPQLRPVRLGRSLDRDRRGFQ